MKDQRTAIIVLACVLVSAGLATYVLGPDPLRPAARVAEAAGDALVAATDAYRERARRESIRSELSRLMELQTAALHVRGDFVLRGRAQPRADIRRRDPPQAVRANPLQMGPRHLAQSAMEGRTLRVSGAALADTLLIVTAWRWLPPVAREVSIAATGDGWTATATHAALGEGRGRAIYWGRSHYYLPRLMGESDVGPGELFCTRYACPRLNRYPRAPAPPAASRGSPRSRRST